MSALKPDGQGNHDLGTTNNRWGALHVQTIATSGDVSVGGALSVSGGITTVKEQELIIGDSMIQLGDGETTNSKDIGFFGEYNDGSSQTFAGLVYDQSASKFFLFSSLTAQPSDTINTGHASFTKATLDLADIDTVTFTATGAASLGSTLGVTGAVSLASTLDVDGNTTLDGLAVSDAATFASTLGVTGEASLDGGIDVDESGSSVFSVHGTSGNTSVGGTLGVTGASTLASVGVTNNATVGGTLGVSGEASLDGGIDVEESASSVFSVNGTSGNTAIAGTLDVDGATTLDGLSVSGDATFGSTLAVTGESTLASAKISDLTSGRVVLAGTDGAVEDNGNLTFNGTTLALTGAATISSTLSAGETTLSSATISDLTSGRVVLAGTSGAVEDNGNLTFNGSTLAVTGAATVSTNATVGGTLGVTGASTLASVGVTNDATVGGALGVTGEASLDGGIDVDESGSSVFSVNGTTGNTSVGGTLAVTSNATVGGTLGVTSEASLDGGIDVAESASSVFSVNGTTGNTAIAGTLDVDGATTLDGLTVSEAATFELTLDVDGATTLDALTVSEAATFESTLSAGETTLSSATISDLTDGRVVLAGTSGAITDNGNLTFNGSTLAVTGAATVSTNLTVSGNLDVDGTTSLDGVSVDGSSTLTGTVGITGTTTLNSGSDLIIKDNSGTPVTVFSVAGASGNTTIAGTLGVTGNTTIGGNLTVNGTTTTVNSTTVTIDDPIFTLGGDTAPENETTTDRGIEFRWHDGSNAKVGFFGYDDDAGRFTFIKDATNTSEVFSGTAGDVAFGAGQFSSMLASNVQIGNAANTVDTLSGNLVLKCASGQKVQIADTLQVTSAATLDSTLLVSGEASLDGGIDVDESGSSVFSVNGTSGNTAIAGTLAVTGESTLASAKISDLTSGRVVLAGTSGAVEDSGNLTFDGTELDLTGNLAVSGTASIGSTLGVTGAVTLASTLSAGETTLSSATISDLTDGRVVLAGTSGAVEDSGNLTFNGSTLAVTGAATVSTNATVGGTLGVTGASTLASVGVTNDATVGGALGVTGEASLDGGIDVDESGSSVFSVNGTTGNTSVGGTLAVTSNATVGGTLGVTSEASLDGGIDVAESASSVFSVNGTTGNTAIAGTLDVDGATTLDGLTVSEAATFELTLDVDGATTLDALTVSEAATFESTLSAGETTLSSATISDLTDGRVVLAGTSGAITDNGNLTFNGSTLAVTGAATVSTNLTVSGNLDVDGTTSLDGVSVDGSSTLTGTVGITGTTTLNSGSDLIIKDNSGTPVTVFSVAGASGNTTIAGTLGVTGNTTIGGNLTVNGTTTTVNSTTVTIDDPIFTLGGDTAPENETTTDRGIEFRWHDGSNAKVGFFGYDDDAGRFTFIKDATNTSEVFSGTAGDVAFGAGQFSSMLASNVQIGNAANTVDTLSGNLVLKCASGQKVQIADTLQVTSAATLDSTLLVSGEASLDGGIDVDESGSSVFSVNGTSGNTAIAGTLAVTGESTLASAKISDLTSGRVVLAGTSGAVEDSGNLTFDGTELDLTGNLAVSGTASIGSTLGVTGAVTLASTLSAGETTLSSATISDLTDGRVVLAGTSGAVEDSGNLTFNGSTLAVTGAATVSTNATVGGTLGVTGASTLASVGVTNDATVGGTLGVTGATTIDGNFAINGTFGSNSKFEVAASSGSLKVNQDKFVVAGTSGNTTVGGNITVAGTGTSAFSGSVTVANSLTVSSGLESGGSTLTVVDPLVLISSGNNVIDEVARDIGIYAKHRDGGSDKFLGLIYDESADYFRLWHKMATPSAEKFKFDYKNEGSTGDNSDSTPAMLQLGSTVYHPDTIALASGATEFAATLGYQKITPHSGNNSIAKITGGKPGMMLILQHSGSGGTLTLTNAGNSSSNDVLCLDGADISLANKSTATLIYDGTNWCLISKAIIS